MNILFIVLALGLGMAIGKAVNGLSTEWFARIGTIVIGIVTVPIAPHPLSIAYVIGFIIQTLLRLWVVNMDKEARGINS